MILDYYGIKLLVEVKEKTIIEYLKNKYSPIVKFVENIDVTYRYKINIETGDENCFIVDDTYRRHIIHGGNRKESYITGVIKQENNCRKIYVERFNVYVIVKNDKREITCYGKHIENVLRVFDLVIIEVFYRTIEKEMGFFHFHASAIADEYGNTLIFSGDKNAGKTTFLMEMILKHNFYYVCNDNCFIGINQNNELLVIPWFEDLKIKFETLDKYDLDQFKVKNCDISWDNKKVYIPLSRAIGEYDIRYKEPGVLKRIVLLEYAEGESLFENGLSYLWKERILNNIRITHDPEHYEFLGLFDEFEEDRFEQVQKVLDRIEKTTQVINVVYNEDTLHAIANELEQKEKKGQEICCRNECKEDYHEIEEVVKSDKYRFWKDAYNNEWNNLRKFRLSEKYQNDYSIVALIDGRIVGHILFCEADISNLGNGESFLYFIQQAIHADYQRKGIGTTLVKYIEMLAKNKKVSGIIALGHDNFFESLGYKKLMMENWKWNCKIEENIYVKFLDNEFNLDSREHVIQIYKLVDDM